MIEWTGLRPNNCCFSSTLLHPLASSTSLVYLLQELCFLRLPAASFQNFLVLRLLLLFCNPISKPSGLIYPLSSREPCPGCAGTLMARRPHLQLFALSSHMLGSLAYARVFFWSPKISYRSLVEKCCSLLGSAGSDFGFFCHACAG